MFTPVNMQNRVKHEWAQIEGQKQNGKGASNKYVRLDGGRGGQPKAYSVNKAM